ncbi:MAG TPA: protein-glutamate O-methyltransferase CheR [Devosia sp.]|nr:protein-glutamate O-methyltransferase CheR [Devosia sp.]
MAEAEVALSDREFDKIRDRIYRIAGISLGDAKRTLVVSRLSKLVRTKGLNSFDAYVDFLDKEATADEKQTFVNALTTNLTRFYREGHHFDHLVDYVRRLIAGPHHKSADGKARLRIWSAGCSTGQEPYTIAMCLMQHFPQLRNWDFRILATDVDTNVVATAAAGTYPQSDLEGLSKEQAKMFEIVGDGTIRVPAPLRKLVVFKPLNLMQDWPLKGPFDAIFCRNVTIYFDKPTQTRIFERFAGLLEEGAFLYIGHSENMRAEALGFRLEGKTIYQRLAGENGRAVA